MIKQILRATILALSLAGCGGGGSPAVGPPAPVQKLVGEVFWAASEMASAELRSNVAYSGNLATSRAIQTAGKHNILDLLFMLPAGDAQQGRPRDHVALDAEQRLQQYARDNQDLLVPGIRVLVVDEIFWNPLAPTDDPNALQAQLKALEAAVVLVKKYIPQASVGMTVTPYAAIDKPNTMESIKKAVSLVDWVGTDPYWFGDVGTVAYLHDWSSTFHGIAKQANPRVETWFIAQAFKLTDYDTGTFNGFIAQQLLYAERYDHLLFFGWQFVSEIDLAAAGMNFAPETKVLYKKYFR